jgi:hypothetical protein
MAAVGQIQIGGRQAGCGIAYPLSEPSPISDSFGISGGSWLAEVAVGNQWIVARTSDRVGRAEVITLGLEASQQALDVFCFEKRLRLQLKSPSDRHVAVYCADGACVLGHHCTSDLRFAFGGGVNMVVTDAAGNVVAPNLPPRSWTAGLRYYRLSQTSGDLYEAYRYLRLSFEAMLHAICPQNAGEREGEWVLRAISTLGGKINLTSFVPRGVTNAAACLHGTHYEHVRCRLFHSKSMGAPIDLPSPEKVAQAYESLVGLVRLSASEYLAVRPGASGGMTHAGFRLLMDGVSDALTMHFTEDMSPATRDDTAVSPMGLRTFALDKATYDAESKPGKVDFVGSVRVNDGTDGLVVGRVCATTRDVLLLADLIEHGLLLSDIDVLESRQSVRMINNELPRTVFSH